MTDAMKRDSVSCPACARPKQSGQIVCPQCFLRHDLIPLSQWNGQFAQWLAHVKKLSRQTSTRKDVIA